MKKNQMKSAKGLLAALVFSTSSVSLAADMKLGYVDMQKAIQSTDAGKKAKKELETDFAAKKKKLESIEKELTAMRDELEKKGMLLEAAAKEKKQREFQERMFEYQKAVGQSQQEIQKREAELTQPILEKLRKTIDKVATADGYTMILEKNEQAVLWAKKESDLTDKVVQMFEKEK
jgi:outer membrane protein